MKALVSFSSQKVAALTKDFLGVTKILGALFYTDLNFMGLALVGTSTLLIIVCDLHVRNVV